MHNPISKFLKQYFYFSKRDRNAITVLIVLIVTGIIINEIIKHIPSKSDYDYYEFAKELATWELTQHAQEINTKSLFPFNPNTISEQELDSILLPDFVIQNLINYRKAGGVFYEKSDLLKLYGMNDSIFREIESYINIPENTESQIEENSTSKFIPEGTFDPNSANKNQLHYFGFNDFQAENLIGYRENGGKFETPIDLLKIYGIDTTFLKEIETYISIENVSANRIEISDHETNISIELNSADSSQLIKLNGIGPVFAERIIKYRNLLGGFINTTQLLEVYNFPEETLLNIEKFLKIDTLQIQQIRINFADYGELIRHPYLNNEQVNSILKHRESNGSIQNAAELNLILGIESSANNKIIPYISFR